MFSRRFLKILAKPATVVLSLAAMVVCLVAAGGNKSSSDNNSKDYALIYGTVWDSHGHPVAGIPVKIRRVADKKARWDLISNNLGEFAQRVPVGKQDYIVWTDLKHKKGQKAETPVQTTVHIDKDERADISLHLTE